MLHFRNEAIRARGPARSNIGDSVKISVLAAALSVTSATAATAAATQVNIADPIAPSRIVRVDPGSRLAVQEVPPSTYFHAFKPVNPASPCAVLAAPPSGKALVVQQL